MADANAPKGGEVIQFSAAASKRREPQLSDAELAEYRAFLPLLRELAEEWPRLFHEHRVVSTGCKLAAILIDSEPYDG